MRRMILILSTAVLLAIVGGSSATPARADFDFPAFALPSGLNLVGDAAPDGNLLRLTPAVADQAGAAWYATKQYVQYGLGTTFQFRITQLGGIQDENGHTGADGFAFVIQNSGADALGLGAAGMGYAFIPNCLAIEFDTWWNHSDLTGAPRVNDPNDNHVGVHANLVSNDTGLESNALATVTPGTDLSDGNAHTVRIEYTPPALKIFLDNMGAPILTVNVNLATLLSLDNGRAFVGLTAATGGAWENHDILSWSFEESLFFGDVQALVNNGTLNAGQGQALLAKLEAALASLKAGNKNAACGQLQAYVNQVKALVKAGILTSQQGQQLIDHASQVRTANGC